MVIDTSIIVKQISRFYHGLIREPSLMRMNERNDRRFLEIGPGGERLEGFETLNIVETPSSDYIADIRQGTRFEDETFDVVYSSHFLEHIEWFNVETVLREIRRILKAGGVIEIWVPDTMKIVQILSDAENGEVQSTPDGWKVRNDDDNPFVWVCGKLFYGANDSYPSWHKGMFTERYLRYLLERCGFQDVVRMSLDECRKDNHGWINLGVKGTKR